MKRIRTIFLSALYLGVLLGALIPPSTAQSGKPELKPEFAIIATEDKSNLQWQLLVAKAMNLRLQAEALEAEANKIVETLQKNAPAGFALRRNQAGGLEYVKEPPKPPVEKRP